MSDEPLQFVSWSRRGIGATRHVDVEINATASGQPPRQERHTHKVTVLGPGDVRPLSNELRITRRWPRPGDDRVEPNFLATIEFEHSDVPWLFSKGQADSAAERLDPWLMLVAVAMAEQQETDFVREAPGSPYRVLTVDQSLVPAAADAWAFAHVQVMAPSGPEAVRRIEETPAHSTVRARIICPTRLEQNSRYLAALVPATLEGCQAGLGSADIGGGPGIVRLPIYDSWTFRTGPHGDFETLASALKPLSPDSDVYKTLGVRRVAIDSIASGLQLADNIAVFATVHEVPTAIAKSDIPGTLAADWPNPLSALLNPPEPAPEAAELHRRLKRVVDTVAEDDTAIVGPPLYGGWAAGIDSIDGHPAAPEVRTDPEAEDNQLHSLSAELGRQTWIEQLNADPYMRIAAGLGAGIVQANQDNYMSQAWEQLSALRAANRRIRWAVLHAEVGSCLHDRLAVAQSNAVLRITSATFGRITGEAGSTVLTAIDSSNLPSAALGSAVTKLSRYARTTPTAPVPRARRLSALVDAISRSEPEAMPPRFSPGSALDPVRVQRVLSDQAISIRVVAQTGIDPATYFERIAELPQIAERIAMNVDAAPPIAVGAPAHVPTTVVLKNQLGDQAMALADKVVQLHADKLPPEAGAIPLSAVAVLNNPLLDGAAPGSPAIRLDTAGVKIQLGSTLCGAAGSILAAVTQEDGDHVLGRMEGVRLAVLASFGIQTEPADTLTGEISVDQDRLALVEASHDIRTTFVPPGTPIPAPPLSQFASSDTATKIVAALEPRGAYRRLLAYAHEITDDAEDIIRRRKGPMQDFYPMYAAPEFPDPIVEQLKTIDKGWILGGVDRLPPNSVSLLNINRRFVEALLAGANHEMARELLWRGYPTVQGGTCFRQFWDAPSPDISTMDAWQRRLGANPAAGEPAEMTALVIKGDLLRRYPNTLISAVHGTVSTGLDSTFTADEGQSVINELFRGKLGDDVTYSVLQVGPDELRKSDANPLHAWYISLLEPSDELRFGLDDSASAAGGAKNNPLDAAAEPDFDATDDWTWQGFGSPTHLTPAHLFSGEGTSALTAAVLTQKPFQALLRAPDYLVEDN